MNIYSSFHLFIYRLVICCILSTGFSHQTNAQDAEGTTLAPKRINQAFATTEANKKVRIVGDGTIAAPQIKLPEKIERLPDAPSASRQLKEAALQKEQLKQTTYRSYKRPLILSSSNFQSGEQIVQISNIIELDQGAMCESTNGQWPCGNFAKAALQRLVKAKPILCDASFDTEELNNKIIEHKCKVGSYQLDEWLIQNGWSDTNHKSLLKMRDEAKQKKLGIWRN